MAMPIVLKMATSTAAGANDNTSSNQYRSRVLTGDLPADFLRVDGVPAGPPAVAAQPTMFASPFGMPALYQKGGVLSLTLVQAKLAKNYGFARMDPYCRLRVGNALFETPTDHNGAKNPRWNKLIQCPLPEGINQIYIELFDEFTFTVDERIAWGMITIKDEIFAGETVDDWYALSGKQGDDKEGMINIILQYREGPIPVSPPVYPPQMMMYQQPMVYSYPSVVTTTTVPAGQQPMQPGFNGTPPTQPQEQRVSFTEADLKTLKDMFPAIDEEIIQSVLAGCGGNVDNAVSNLLSMSEGQ